MQDSALCSATLYPIFQREARNFEILLIRVFDHRSREYDRRRNLFKRDESLSTTQKV